MIPANLLKTAVVLLSVSALVCSCAPKTPDYNSLTADNHPRLVLNDKDFAKVRRIVSKAGERKISSVNSCILLMHQTEMGIANKVLADTSVLRYQKDESGRRILSVSKAALTRIWSNAYAYRYTGDERYLHHAEFDINTVCDFPGWNPDHYLDVAEMCNAVAFGYDWLYDSLADSTKSKAVNAIRSFAMDTAPGKSFYYVHHNWNQVCTGGLICGALATYEEYPEQARTILDTCIHYNKMIMSDLYAPDGAYKEGPAYWMYGSNYEAVLLTVLEGCLGTDFGISEGEGFDRTGCFIQACQGNLGLSYNYADNSPYLGIRPALWYLADRFKEPSLADTDMPYLYSGQSAISYAAMMPVIMKHALNLDRKALTGKSAQSSYFFSQGETPLAIVRTGFGKEDIYLGAKGGTTMTNHSHLDAGSFIYESDGIRWAVELGAVNYATTEAGLKSIGGDLWKRSPQNSMRWKLFRYNNAQHNTISIIGKQHLIEKYTPMTETFDDKDRMGATFDMTGALGDDFTKAIRTLIIRDRSYLEVTDSLCAADSAAVPVQWTLVTMAKPEIVRDGIILRQEGKTMKLSCSDTDVRYVIRSSDPKDYDSPTAFCEPKESAHICGFEATIPAGGTKKLVTTLKSIANK